MTDHADLIKRLDKADRDIYRGMGVGPATAITLHRDLRAALADSAPREQMTADQFREAVGLERASHEARGYDEAHDRAHGVVHLLGCAIDYAARGEAAKSGSLIVAALSVSSSLEREERALRAERDALAAQRSQMRALVIDALANADDTHMGWDADMSASALLDILDTAPAASLARHDAEVKAQALEEEAKRWDEMHGMSWCSMVGRSLHQQAAAIRAEAAEEGTITA